MHAPKISDAVEKCLPPVTNACKKSSFLATKILRAYMHDLEHLLLRHDDWIIVHLIRDPENVILSQAKHYKHLIKPQKQEVKLFYFSDSFIEFQLSLYTKSHSTVSKLL